MSAKGLTHVYYGYGKGKTTAAFGLALRAAGQGGEVVIVQFLKNSPSGEVKSCAALDGITVLRGMCEGGAVFSFQMTPEQKDATLAIHNENLRKAISLARGGSCEVLVLDEALDALTLGLLDEELFYGLLESKPPELELVITGHDPIERVTNSADYITEMVAHRHPYERGVQARRGVEF